MKSLQRDSPLEETVTNRNMSGASKESRRDPTARMCEAQLARNSKEYNLAAFANSTLSILAQINKERRSELTSEQLKTIQDSQQNIRPKGFSCDVVLDDIKSKIVHVRLLFLFESYDKCSG